MDANFDRHPRERRPERRPVILIDPSLGGCPARPKTIMRSLFLIAALTLTGTAAAQEPPPSFKVQSVNGVRVWSPKQSPTPPIPVVVEKQTVIIKRLVPGEPTGHGAVLVPYAATGARPHRLPMPPRVRPLVPSRRP